MNVIKPQAGYQTKALSSSADIVIGGGAAGVGKTFSLLMEPMRHFGVKNFGAVLFRRTTPEIKAEGGLWDESIDMYTPIVGAKASKVSTIWEFGNGVTMKFSGLQYEQDVYKWQSSQIPLILFDELIHFSKNMFFYMLSRNRSKATCVVTPYVRCTCNPDPDSWVRTLIDWWIGLDGYPIPERDGVFRYFMRDKGHYIWGETKAEVIEKGWHAIEEQVKMSGISAEHYVKSLTFISGSIYDNKKLLGNNPEYLGNLNAQSEENKARLLLGNWNYKSDNDDVYDYLKFRDMFTNEYLKTQYANDKRYLTCDIAMKGSDNMVVLAWQGKILIGFLVLGRTKGNEVVNAVRSMAIKHKVPYSNIAFDNDGVGSFVDGFITGAREFNNNARAKNDESYKNLKSQCFLRSGDAVERGDYYIPEDLADMEYAEGVTFKEQILRERKAIKRDKPDHDQKLCVLPKQEMKVYLDGRSPDLMDAFMMREFFDLQPPAPKVSYY